MALVFGFRARPHRTNDVIYMNCRYGYGDVALSVLLNDAYPSIGHMAHQNMTTLCENWACTYHAAGGGSQNHIMLGGFDGEHITSASNAASVAAATTSAHVSASAAATNGATYCKILATPMVHMLNVFNVVYILLFYFKDVLTRIP